MKDYEGEIKDLLDSLIAKYGKSYLETDPVSIVHRFKSHDDIEVVGFISALLAFGNAKQIKRSVEAVLGRLGPHPANFVKSFDYRQRGVFEGFRHRFVGEDSIAVLFLAMNRIFTEQGSLRDAFQAGFSPGDMLGSLIRFVKIFKMASGDRSESLRFLLPDPELGSACKRLFLFLRWMVRRDDGVDFGIFDSVSPKELVIPLDTHIARLSYIFGFTKRKSRNLQTALEITDSLRRFDPSDPVKYDFALTRIGIVEGCRGVYLPDRCLGCCARGVCKMLGTEKH